MVDLGPQWAVESNDDGHIIIIIIIINIINDTEFNNFLAMYRRYFKIMTNIAHYCETRHTVKQFKIESVTQVQKVIPYIFFCQ